MRPDPGTILEPAATTSARPEASADGRTWRRPAWAMMLVLLITGTCWAVASCVSAWLVPPYLVLMAWILLPSAGRPQGEPAAGRPGSSEVPSPAEPVEEAVDALSTPEPHDPPIVADPPSKKGRKGRSKARKARVAPESYPEAAWRQVAPGKFVRIEAPDPPAEPGPFDPSKGPDDDGANPPTPVEAEPGAGSGREDRPAERQADGFEGPSPAPIEGPEGAGSPTEDGQPPTADGNAPRVDGPVVDLDEKAPEEAPEEGPDRVEFASNPPEIVPEVVDDGAATPDQADPTETPADEADLDDAGPIEWSSPEVLDAPEADFDPESAEPDPEPSHRPESEPAEGPARRTRTRRWQDTTRPIAARSAIRSEATLRRLDRTPDRGRRSRPTDPRRLGRRGDGRPRRFARTFPPRSPPSRRRSRGRIGSTQG